jgi:hypothetical protein
MTTSPETAALDTIRVLAAAVLCFLVPFAALYSVAALESVSGLMTGLVPLGGAVWLLASARLPVGARVGLSVAALAGTAVWSVVVISSVFRGWSS